MEPYCFTYESMGTHWEISIWDPLPDSQRTEIRKEILTFCYDFDHLYSRFIPTSLIWKLTKQTGTISVPKDLTAMLRMYETLYIPSQKKLNPLIGFTISDLGYDDSYSLQAQETVRYTPDFLETIRIRDEYTIEIAEQVLIDIGALGKGYAVDCIFTLLQEKGLKHILVNGGGDIRYEGPEPIRLGLEDPADASKAIGILEMNSGAFAASGINRRAWGNQHHIVDPESSTVQYELLATWVRADSAVLADALATTLLLSDPGPLRAEIPFSYCIMNSTRKIKRSADFSAKLF